MLVVYSFIGRLPEYAVTTVHQLRLFYDGPVFFILDDFTSPYTSILYSKYGVEIVPYSDVVDHDFLALASVTKLTYCMRTLVGREFLFLRAFERFYLLHNFMMSSGATNVLFLELDNLLYDNPITWLPTLQKTDIAYLFDNINRASGGVTYVKNATSLKKLLDSFNVRVRAGGETIDEMDALYTFWKNNHETGVVQFLPIYWTDPSIAWQAHTSALSFSDSIFDAAALGICIGGIDPVHSDGVVKYGVHWQFSLIDYTKCTVEWRVDDRNRRIPYIWSGSKWLRINNLHIHSKLLQPMLSLPIS